MAMKTQPVRWRYLLLEMGAVLLVSYLMLLGGTKSQQLNPSVLAINAGLMVLTALFLLFKGRSLTAIEVPVMVMMGVMLLASLTSIDPRRSLGEFGLVAIPVSLFLLVSEAVRRGFPRELITKVLLIVGAIFMVLRWIEFGAWYLRWLKTFPGQWLPDANFRLENPNIMAMLFNVWLMLAVARLLSARKGVDRAVLAIVSLSGLAIVYLTSSRGGWLATAAGLACIALVVGITRRAMWLPAWQKLIRSRLFIAGAGLAVVLIALAGGFLLIRQLSQPTHGGRTEFWTPAWQAFVHSPVLGKGPFTFVSAFLQSNSTPPMVPVDYAHSLYLDLLSGSGLVGLLIFGWVMFVAVRLLLWRIRADEGLDWSVSVGALAALVTFLVHGTVDSVHASEPVSLWNMCVLFGAGLTVAEMDGKKSFWQAGLKSGLVLAAAGLTLFALWTLLPIRDGVRQANAHEWQAALASFQEARRRDPSMAVAWQQTGLAEGVLAGANQKQLDAAIGDFRKAVELDPYWGLNHANLGALDQAAGRGDEAAAEFGKAASGAPRSEIFQLNLGIVEEERGNRDAAAQAYQAVLSLQPDWVEARFWRENPFRQKVHADWTAAHPVNTGSTQAVLESQVRAGNDYLTPYTDLARIYLEQGRVADADQVLRRSEFATASNSRQLLEQVWLKAETLALQDDSAAAAELGKTVLNAYLNYGVFGAATPANDLYTTFMFRRPAAKLDLVPQVKVILWPDLWGRRALTLADWLEKSGQPAEAAEWRQRVGEAIPDLEELNH